MLVAPTGSMGSFGCCGWVVEEALEVVGVSIGFGSVLRPGVTCRVVDVVVMRRG